MSDDAPDPTADDAASPPDVPASGGDPESPSAVPDPAFDVPLRGIGVGEATRCAHYGTERDVVAFRFACCDTYYPCHACHDALTDHAVERWPRDRFDEPAVLCGVCRTELTANTYLDSPTECPFCGAPFNPGCVDHHDRYFALDDSEA